MSFLKKGKSFPGGKGSGNGDGHGSGSPVVRAVRDALRQELGSTHAAAKTVARWTGANERTVKNWLSGYCGPSGEHLVALARHSDEVLVTFLALAGRTELATVASLAQVRGRVRQMLASLDGLLELADIEPNP